VVKNKYYVCLSDCRRNHGESADYLAACDTWRSELVDDARSQFSDGNISRKELNAFLSEVERGARDGRMRAAQQQRKSTPITPARTDELVRFATRLPAGGRKTFCFISRNIPRHAPGGIARYIWDLATGFAQKGHETHLITLTDGPSMVEFSEGLWIRHISRGELVPSATIEQSDSGAAALRSDAARANTAWAKAAHGEVLRLRQDRYIDQIVAPVWDQEGLYCALDRRLNTVISMNTTFHRYAGIEESRIDSNTLAELSALERTYIRSSRYFLSNSSSSTAHLRQDFGIDPAAAIAEAPHGVADIDPALKQRIMRRERKPEDPVRVLYVSRLEKRKGTDLFLTVAIETLKNHRNVIFEMVGRDSYQDDPGAGYATLFTELAPELNKRFIRHGEVTAEDLEQLYSQADIFFVPSRYESFGIIFVEAMRCYLPVLTLDIGGARDIVEHGVTGLLAEAENTEQLADFLSQLINDPVRRATLGAAARARYERLFENEAVIDATLEALKFSHVAK
jgi:glycosyltransferase involved in cell wall biosynthesis